MNAPVITIPQANPGAGYRALQAEIDAAVARALASGWYILGGEGRAFEGEYAAWLGTARAVGCANGTDALALALRALGIGPGSAVATVSHTAVATVAAIEMVGATPVLIDIDPAHYTMDPVELAAVLDRPPAGLPPIRAVIPVHLYGQAADLAPIMAACTAHGVAVIEDCSQAHGATLDGRKLGTFTEISCFSLYPTKNLGALGDGGVVATHDDALATRVAALRQYGWHTHYISDEVGVNSRLDEIQAAVLRVKLAHLDAQNARRQAIAAAYDYALMGGALKPPARRAGAAHVFHQYVLRAADRTGLQARLRAEGIGTGIHYPMPVHLQPAYRGRVAMGPARCAQTERASAEVLSLPMFPELTDEQVAQVCAALRRL
ncbi:DegT/DnrJ/EryC1/StrS family aminotransferase [Limobrevibacterium gyesilva]|uniref:DegT/DnrJ/EryC1/StrS family aminotransferase n=1 Tax=Limobrevibacterium gyesilva TaxID=2991712 RepID=A0AA41YMT7_9PROT|nr:DegT/DnrJ/EryC1/StrS family aminotransferase [Limobrevibacterium gyesilva]MCW3476789.1 DegT/DnrJ/EryC1/StrS family aminotransferase [Limobrevibacterium gyesilva]